MSKLFRFLGLISHLKAAARAWPLLLALLFGGISCIVLRSNEPHSAYFAKKGAFANVTNLSHAIAYAEVPFSRFEAE